MKNVLLCLGLFVLLAHGTTMDAHLKELYSQGDEQEESTLIKKSYTKNPRIKAHRCELPLGMEDGQILDHQITADSSKSSKSGPGRGRLHLTGKNGAWTGGNWLQIDLGDVTKVTKVATQGRYDADEWVRRYYISFSIDGQHFTFYKDHRSYVKYFSGNTDRNTVVTNKLTTPIYARYVRFHRDWLHKRVSMRVEVYGCRNVQRCMIPLGMEDKRIPDNAITASHQVNNNFRSFYGRLRTNSFRGWCTSRGGQYLQIDLGDVKTVRKLATQGYLRSTYRTKRYWLQYSVDGIHWEYYRRFYSSTSYENFAGNSEVADSVHTNTLQYPIVARYVRFRPQSYYGWYCLRVELYGCKHVCSEPLGAADYRIKNNEFSSNVGGNPHYARLNVHHGWQVSGGKNRYLQLDLRTPRKITAVATQGHYSSSYWVRNYKLSYSLTGDNRQWVYFTKNGIPKIFHGNEDQYTPVMNTFEPAIYARYVKFWPVTWNGKIVMRVELYGCKTDDLCSLPLGIEDKRVVSGAMKASSEKNSKCSAKNARLNSGSAWIPKHLTVKKKKPVYKNNEWLQIHLTRLTVISKIATQGHQTINQWVTSFYLKYSMDGRHWDCVRNPSSGKTMVFNGNSDKTTVVINDLQQSITAHYVRIIPMTWVKAPAIRMELFGCYSLEKAPHCARPLGMENRLIRSTEISASSILSSKFKAHFSRIRFSAGPSWCSKTNDSKQWLQIDLRIVKTITKIAVQPGSKGYVKSYTISHGVTGYHWKTHKENGKVKEFLGNYNAESFVTQQINPSIHARFIRIQPKSWHGRICLKTELFGCLVEGIGQ